eukprot:9115317-Pyramimonas_sp.AAC.1
MREYDNNLPVFEHQHYALPLGTGQAYEGWYVRTSALCDIGGEGVHLPLVEISTRSGKFRHGPADGRTGANCISAKPRRTVWKPCCLA